MRDKFVSSQGNLEDPDGLELIEEMHCQVLQVHDTVGASSGTDV